MSRPTRHSRRKHGHGGDLFGFDLAPGNYSREVVFLYRFPDARITNRWAVRDDLTMLRELGALTPK